MKLKKYLLLTFGISWLCWGLLLFLQKLSILEYRSTLGYAIAFVGVLGPTISSILLLEEPNIKNITKYIFYSKRKTGLYVVLFCIILILSYALTSPLNKEIPIILYLPLFMYAITFGGGLEELGWRGILQLELEKKIPYFVATLLTGFTWAMWHLPLFFIEGTGQLGESFFVFLIVAILMSFWLSCIYKKTKSIFYCSIFHGLYNTLTSIFIIESTWSVITGYVCMTILSIILCCKSISLNNKKTNDN